MPSPSYYIRFRGQVTGPFGTEELRKMAQRGGLSRFHELSADRLGWSFASKYGWLFSGGESPEPLFARGTGAETDVSPIPIAEPQFYYPRGGATIGPISATTLRAQVAQGSLEPTDLVWADGAEDPVIAAEVPALADLFPDQYGVRHQRRRAPWLLIGVGVAFVVALTAVVVFVLMMWK